MLAGWAVANASGCVDRRMKPLCRSSVPALLLACAALGCSSEGEEGDDRLAELEACGARELTPCDILDPSCQERIAEIAACQWGGEGTPALLPEVTTRTEDDYRALLAQAAPARDAAQQAVDTSLALLGLIDPGDLSDEALIDHTAERVLAYYDFETKGINLIARETTPDLSEADGTLLHELIHAQQDAAHDLAGLQARGTPSTDGVAAAQGLYEGEASFQEWLFQAMLAGVQLDTAVVDASLRRRLVENEDDVFAGPHVLSSALQLLPYTYGAIWIGDAWLGSGRAAVQSRYEHPPGNCLPALRAGWDAGSDNAPKLLTYPTANIYFRGERPGPGSELIPLALDRLGAYSLYIVARLLGDTALGEQLALGWRGDQLDVYQLEAGGSAGRWQVRFADDASASAFAELMRRNSAVSVRISERTVVCVVSESGARPEWLFGPLGAL
jgi:hypothetical protein